MEIIYKTVNNRREPLREVFSNMEQSSNDNSPLWFEISGTIGWGILSISIIHNEHQLRHYNEGLTLCAFVINYLEGNRENKLSYTILEKGMDCIKSLSEFLLNQNIKLEYNLRKFIKDLLNGGIDAYKENIKKTIEEEGLLSTP